MPVKDAIGSAVRMVASADGKRWSRYPSGDGPPSYTTTFPLTENPISEGGLWTRNASGIDQTAVRTEVIGGVHVAHGTQSGHSAPPYDDSNTHISGFSGNYEVEATVWLGTNTGTGTFFKEFEILLRWSDTNTTYAPPVGGAFGNTNIRGYEVAVAWNGAYFNLGRYKFSTALADDGGSGLGVTPATGDKFRARIEGQRIRMWWNDVLKIDFTDNDATYKVTTGDPGIGFWANNVPSNELGYSAVTVRQL